MGEIFWSAVCGVVILIIFSIGVCFGTFCYREEPKISDALIFSKELCVRGENGLGWWCYIKGDK